MTGRAGSGPPDDLAAFYAEQYGRVRGTLALITGDRGVAEELAQEAFTRACQHWERVRHLDAPGAWVHRVAVNLAISRGRTRRTERRLGERLRAQRTPDGTGSGQVEDRDAVRTALLRLPEDQRTVVVLRFHADCSVAEAARVLGWPEGTVKTRTRRALAALRADGLVLGVEEGDDGGATVGTGSGGTDDQRPRGAAR